MRRIWRLLPKIIFIGLLIPLLKRIPKEPKGSYLGIPYDFTPPTLNKIRERLWNPEDSRIFTPHVFGWGWGINFYALRRRLFAREEL